MKVTCITNNKMITDIFEAAPGRVIRFIDETSKDVFRVARDLIHSGWELLGHPMYGNFRPSKQPFRTLALQQREDGSLDITSLALIEEALSDENAPMIPKDLSEGTRHDFAVIDFELMKETMSRFYKGSTRSPK